MQRILLLLALVFSLPTLAEGEAKKAKVSPPAVGDLKIDTGKLKGIKKGAVGKRAGMPRLVEASRQVTRGYYKALIAGDYERAASFLHPDAIEPSRAALIESLEKGGEGQTKATLAAIGVPDMNTLRTMPAERFFVVYARSPMGKGVQLLNGLAVRVVLEPPRCDEATQSCQVRLKLKGETPKGDEIDRPNIVYVVNKSGRFLLQHTPVKRASSKSPKKAPAKAPKKVPAKAPTK